MANNDDENDEKKEKKEVLWLVTPWRLRFKATKNPQEEKLQDGSTGRTKGAMRLILNLP